MSWRTINGGSGIIGALLAGALVLGACGGEPAPEAGTSPTDAAVAVTVADIEADLAPLLQERYGEAQLVCGMTDMFAGGGVQSVVRLGNAFPCMYINDPESRDIVWVDLLVLMTGDDAYGVHVTREVVATEEQIEQRMQAEGDDFAGMLVEPTSDPEWMYRDGLACAELVLPVTDETAPGPDFEGLFDWDETTEGLSYAEILYYFYDNDRPADLDPDGDGRPCTEYVPEDEVAAFYDGVRQVSGSETSWQPTSPTVTTLDIRSAIAAAGLPPKATQVDCALAGPVSVGSLFSCAPRLNQMAESQVVVVLEPDGSYLAVGQKAMDAGLLQVPPAIFREGLTCDELAAPVTPDTLGDLGMPMEEVQQMLPEIGDQGLDYLGTVLYFHLQGRPSDLDPDGNGWPCEEQYPAEDLDQVRKMLALP